MAFVILMIMDQAETERLARSLQRIWGRGLRIVTDTFVGCSPEEQLLQTQPDVVLLGMGQLGMDVQAYVAAARTHLPRAAVCLICDRAHHRQAHFLCADRILQRPVAVAEVQACLAELSKLAREREDPRLHGTVTTSQPPLPEGASASAKRIPTQIAPKDLLRLDDVFANPLSLALPLSRKLPELAPVLQLTAAAPLEAEDLIIEELPLSQAQAG